jgi:hypothetical protein
MSLSVNRIEPPILRWAILPTETWLRSVLSEIESSLAASGMESRGDIALRPPYRHPHLPVIVIIGRSRPRHDREVLLCGGDLRLAGIAVHGQQVHPVTGHEDVFGFTESPASNGDHVTGFSKMVFDLLRGSPSNARDQLDDANNLLCRGLIGGLASLIVVGPTPP